MSTENWRIACCGENPHIWSQKWYESMEESCFYFRWNRVSQSTGGMALWPLDPSTTRLGGSQETQSTQRVVVRIALLWGEEVSWGEVWWKPGTSFLPVGSMGHTRSPSSDSWWHLSHVEQEAQKTWCLRCLLGVVTDILCLGRMEIPDFLKESTCLGQATLFA